MNNLKYSIRELKNSLFFKIVLILQLMLVIILTYRIIESKNYQNEKLSSMNEIIGNKTIYQIALKYDSIDEFLEDQKDENKFSNFALDIDKNFNMVTTVLGEIKLPYFNGIEKFLDNDFKESEQGEEMKSVYSLQCSPNFFDTFNIGLSEGSLKDFEKFSQLNSVEWENKYIPIVLGNAYKGIFNIGDIIENKYFNYKVVGFIEENRFFLDKGVYDLSRVKNLNTFIITPMPKDIINANVSNAFLVYNSDPREFNEVKKEVESLAKNNKVKISVYDPNENIDTFTKEIKYNINLNLLLIYIVGIFAIGGFVVIFCNRVLDRRKEFSIHIMHGATISDICFRVIIEQFILVFISTIIAYSYLMLHSVNFVTEVVQFQYGTFAKSISIIIGAIILVSMIPIYYIKKYKLNYLIKGE